MCDMKVSSTVTPDKVESIIDTLVGELKVVITDVGVEIFIEGYGVKTQENGAPIYLDFFGGVPKLYVWGHINQEDPTHSVEIGLNGARSELYVESEDDYGN